MWLLQTTLMTVMFCLGKTIIIVQPQRQECGACEAAASVYYKDTPPKTITAIVWVYAPYFFLCIFHSYNGWFGCATSVSCLPPCAQSFVCSLCHPGSFVCSVLVCSPPPPLLLLLLLLLFKCCTPPPQTATLSFPVSLSSNSSLTDRLRDSRTQDSSLEAVILSLTCLTFLVVWYALAYFRHRCWHCGVHFPVMRTRGSETALCVCNREQCLNARWEESQWEQQPCAQWVVPCLGCVLSKGELPVMPSCTLLHVVKNVKQRNRNRTSISCCSAASIM